MSSCITIYIRAWYDDWVMVLISSPPGSINASPCYDGSNISWHFVKSKPQFSQQDILMKMVPQQRILLLVSVLLATVQTYSSSGKYRAPNKTEIVSLKNAMKSHFNITKKFIPAAVRLCKSCGSLFKNFIISIFISLSFPWLCWRFMWWLHQSEKGLWKKQWFERICGMDQSHFHSRNSWA